MVGIVLLLAAGVIEVPQPPLSDVDGKVVTWSEFEGSKVVMIHFASW